MSQLSLPLLTLYADLLQQLDTANENAGSVFRQDIKGIVYLKAHISVAGGRRTVHLGRADDPDVSARALAITQEMQRAKERRRIVAALRDAGFGTTTPLIGRVAEAVAAAGLFRAGMVLVGTGAFQCFPPLVGATLPVASMVTQDADLATASLALAVMNHGGGPDEAGALRSLEDILRDADPSFTGLPQLDPRALPSRFRTASGFVVDVLVPRLRRQDTDPMPIPGLRAGGTPLQHMDWLIEAPTQAAMLHASGILVRLPRPARYAVHKLIIAQKRQVASGPKRFKDLEQARVLIAALRARDPFALSDALQDAMDRGASGWKQPIERSLRELGLEAEPLLSP